MTLSIKFLGATGTVTGSRYLLSHNGTRILVDCGMFQGLKDLRLRNWNPFPVDPTTINAILVTHAHLDHSGYLPRLYHLGFRGKIYCSAPTQALCGIILPDSAHIQEEDAKFYNKHKISKHSPALPLYTVEEAKQTLELIQGVNWNTETKVGDFGFSFNPVSHLLGASSIEIKVASKKIVFSGDLGRDKDPILPERTDLKDANYIIVESTYGDREHPESNVKDELSDVITKTINRGGTVLIPTFAVGRAQALIYIINQLKNENRIPDVPVYLNSPMAIQATKTHYNFASELKMPKHDLEEALKDVIYANSPNQSKQIDESRVPKIVLSSSGMLVGGRILHHLKSMGPDPKNAIVLVGFQAAGTRGEILKRGKKELKVHGQMVPINAEVHALQNLSGHADYHGILNWLGDAKATPNKVFVTHGEPVSSKAMCQKIIDKFGWDVIVPEHLQEIQL